MGIVNSKFVYSTTGTAALAAAVLYYYFIRPITERRAKSNRTLVLGLKNFGYTCYLNSILQALASCTQFADWIRINNEVNAGSYIDHPFDPNKKSGGKFTLTRSAFPIVAVLHRAFFLINRVIRGDDEYHSSQVPGDIMKVFNEVLDDKYKSERRTIVNKFRLIDTEEQDTHEVFNHLMSNLSDEFGNESRRTYDKTIKALISHEQTEALCTIRIANAKNIANGVTGGKISLNSTLEKNMGATGDSETERLHKEFLLINPTIINDPNKNIVKTKIKLELEDDSPTYLRVSMYNTFQGTCGSQLQCISCLTRRSIHIESFSSVSLNLPPETNGTVSIYELLESYTKPIIVHSVDCDSCSNKAGSKMKSSFYRKSAFAKLPTTLCLHILRTEWNRDGTSYKRKDHVRFPIKLNLTDALRITDILCPDNRKRKLERKQQRRLDQYGDHIDNGPRYRNSQYSLRSIVSHRGDVDSGHFVTYRRSPKNEFGEEVWLLVSDMLVVPVSLEEVLTAKAYMLFYEKLYIPIIDNSGTFIYDY